MSYYRRYSSTSTLNGHRSTSAGSYSNRYLGYNYFGTGINFGGRNRYRPNYRRHWSRRYLISDADIEEDTRAFDIDDDKPTTNKTVGLIKTTNVNLHEEENRQAHHTDEYELENLIIRRGQSFKITVTFDRDFNKKTDSVILQFVTGNRPLPSKNSLVRVSVVDNLKPGEWGAKVTASTGSTITYEIQTPATSTIVAPWNLYVITRLEEKTDDPNVFRHKVEDDIYILFNPWNKDDQVYMENDDERQEYVMNDTGLIWGGNAKTLRPRNWNFGQFEDVCLLASMKLLEISEVGGQARSNATQVVRALAALANSNDDNGVLAGNWSGDYRGGTPPYSWNGSVAILEKYMTTRREVKYGQCWVFSGLLTTLCRTLGIPTRSVTNYESAHDTDYSMTIDFHWDISSGKPKTSMNDSIWNFHVWNESWLRRPDLPKGYDGWQAHDATPQEMSEGIMRCGPSPLAAIKKGEVYYGYDTKFIFAEVNGDKVSWAVGHGGTMFPFESDSSAVGKFISTKAVGKDERYDITDQYKSSEGSKEERAAVSQAQQHSSRKELLIEYNKDKDCDFDLVGHGMDTGDLTFTFTVKNNAKEKRTINLALWAMATYYTGFVGEKIKEANKQLVVEPGTESEFEMPLPGYEYMNTLDADAHVTIYCKADVEETGYIFATKETFEADKPDLILEPSTKFPRVGHSFEITVKFTNTLSVALTNGVLSIEGPGIQKAMSVNVKRPIQPGKEYVETIQLKPRFAGKRGVIASLNTRQITSVTGSVMLDVKK